MKDQDAVSALGALAQDDRLAAFRLLMAVGPRGLPSGTVAERLDIQPTRMSFHLTTLERAGLLSARRDGRHIHYAVNFARMKNLLTFLMEDCCGNNPAVCGFSAEEFTKPTGVGQD
ncbi:ArsR/SmtB family transcription factor [Roseibium marinum]|uniref:DNA-binding transcriptional ArsR family regulator n=1 Tax=Roseibium marinum TaxID=281252 RepID=A0A2S3ULZ4_9HYPH|nr:helix-turn-helix domain-containing protein [Roseibium marinum]POF28742.1 DNA-binding transcriptional ArsR family regulator [Roseibium marinum]